MQNDYAVKDAEETRGFAQQHDIQYLCKTVEDMLYKVDVGFIQGANWDTHLPKARPFLKAGKPVFIDKPRIAHDFTRIGEHDFKQDMLHDRRPDTYAEITKQHREKRKVNSINGR